jgi:hypothetical protein
MSFKAQQRARFWELTAAAEAIRAKSEPLRKARDAFISEAKAKDRDLVAKIRAAETELFDIEAERTFLAKGLGRVGPRPEGE